MAASDTPHALFSIAELLIGIVEAIPDKDSFWDNYDFRNTSFSRTIKTLLMLACVSKDFKEPALNTLWRRMSNFSPLFRLLPSNVVVHSKKRWSFVTPGEAADMSLPFVDARAKDTFLDYARRIRSITFIHDASVDVMEWIFAFGSPTFPALTHFIWGARDVANLQLCRPLMTSTLHSFLVKFYCGGKCKEMLAEFNAAVSALVQVASSDLTTFAVQHEDDELPNEESLELTDILVRGLPCAPMLERFIMKDMTLGAAAIAVLSTAPKLRVFEASLADDVQAFAVGSNLFSGLGRLTLHGSILNCTAFISALSSPSRVTVFLVQLADKAISNEAAFDIARNVRLTFGNQLQTLQLRHSTGLPSIIMPPLFECSKLQSVDITIKVEDDEQSSELDEQAWEAWPDLSTLKWR